MCTKMSNVQELIDRLVDERPRFDNAPLKEVICQVQFPRQLSLDDDVVRPIQRALSQRYPMFVDGHMAKKLLAEDAPGAYFPSPGAGQRIFRFRDAGGTWTATIGPEAIALETTDYVGMKDLLLRWSELATTAAEALELTAQTRLGLRYINKLDFPAASQEDLSSWVREELVTLPKAQPQAKQLLYFVSHSQFREPNGLSCHMRHGLAPPAPREDSGDRAVFLLDLDCYRGETAKFDPVDQIRSLARLGDCAYGYFTWAFQDQTLRKFSHSHTPSERKGPGWLALTEDQQQQRQQVFEELLRSPFLLDYDATSGTGRAGPSCDDLLEIDSEGPDFTPEGQEDDEGIGQPTHPLSAILGSMRESIDIPVADLARMIGLRRRQFYNLLADNPTSADTEARIRRLAVEIERLARATEGGPEVMRAAILTPVGSDAVSLFEVAAAGDEERLREVVTTLLAQIEVRGVRRTRRAIPRAVPPEVAQRRRRLMRESMADRSPPSRRRDGGE